MKLRLIKTLKFNLLYCFFILNIKGEERETTEKVG